MTITYRAGQLMPLIERQNVGVDRFCKLNLLAHMSLS